MKQLLVLLVSIPSFFIAEASGLEDSKNKAIKVGKAAVSLQVLAKLTPKEYQKLTGQKLKLRERIGLKILQWKAKRAAHSKPTGKQRLLGWGSLLLGILGIFAAATATAGAVVLGGLLCVGGLILAVKSLKGNANAGGILALFICGIGVIVCLFAAGTL